MARITLKSANLLNPVPCVMISCKSPDGKENIMTAAWAGTVCSDPVMVSVSIRKSRCSHDMILESGEFVMNLTNRATVKAADFVGIKSGRNLDKFDLFGDLHLTRQDSVMVAAPTIKECPLALECKVKQVLELGSHDMFLAEVVCVTVDESVMDEKGRINLEKADLVAYSHGEYFALGEKLGRFSYSTQKAEKLKTRQIHNQQKKKQG